MYDKYPQPECELKGQHVKRAYQIIFFDFCSILIHY